MNTEKAILAGGCFWGVEELIRQQPGVISTVVGYTGGDVPNATYRNHGTHAEGIEVVFDPSVISYRKLLEYFFQIHNPTTRNRQGNDVGMSYRSAIFYLDETQRETANTLIAEMDASGNMAGQNCYRSSTGRRFLERRSRTPGLPAKKPIRLYLPLRTAGMDAELITYLSKHGRS
jgi:peptide-methionine (S)-S-oxide reductase